MAQPQTPAAPGGWTPTPQGLASMVALFGDPDPSMPREQQQQMYQQLGQLRNDVQYTAYLAYIVLHLRRHAADVASWLPHGTVSQVDDIRARAGLELKNRMKEKDLWQQCEPAMRAFVKETALSCLVDSKSLLRIVGGNIVTTVAKTEGLQNWPGLLQHLVGLLDSNQSDAMDGGFSALCMICEDMPRELDSDALQRPLTFLIPKLLTFFKHPDRNVRRHAIATVNVFLKYKPMALLTNLTTYLENLFVMAGHEQSPEIRRRVCNAFVLLLDPRYFPSLQAHIEQVIQFMLAASNDADESVCLDAMEFWSAYCRSEVKNLPLLQKYLEHLVPTLLKSMRYSEDELVALGEDDDDDDNQAVPDRPEDTRPFHKHQKESGMGQDDADDGDDEDDANEEADWLDEDEVTAWTVRKCAADALEKLSTVFHEQLLPHLLPKLQEALNTKGAKPEDERTCWVIRESAVLALGAIAEGCMASLRPFLPQLLPFLVTQFLTDSKPLVRSITCWTVSRYIRWVIDETVVTHKQNHAPLFAPLLKALLERVLDKNKKVQEAACSAMATLEEEARVMLVPYLADILRTLMRAYTTYQARNMLVLYDTLSTLCDAVHQNLQQPELISILMPPLMTKWSVLPHNDINLLPLFECLTVVAQALGTVFLPFAENVFGRCLHVIELTLQASKEAERIQAAGGDADLPDKEFMVCAIDLLSGLAEALGDQTESIVGRYSSRALGALYECAKDLDPDVRQSAFALLGDWAKSCIGHLRPHLKLFVPLATRNLNPLFFYVCNNASWSIGMLAIKAGGADMAPYVDEVLTYLNPILSDGDPDMQRGLLENAAITVGRLAYICAPLVAKHLQELSVKWLTYLAPLTDDQEKEHAFRGLLLAIQQNPQAIYNAGAVPHLAKAIESWKEPQPELATQFYNVLQQFKQSLGPQWEPIMATCDPAVRARLFSVYKV